MAIKESSDELNPAVTVSPSAVAPRQRRTGADYFALAISTCGVGYFPIAPGTLGSLVGVALYVSVFAFGHHVLFAHHQETRFTEEQVWMLETTVALVVIFLVTMIGIWAGTRAERLIQKKD